MVANLTGLWLAIILGIISPKIKSKEVITTTCTRKVSHTEPPKSNIREVTNAETITMATLTKLLVIRMVASNRLGRSKCLTIKRLLYPFWVRIFFSDWGSREKKATSAPDTRAERNNKTKTIIVPATASTEKDSKNATSQITGKQEKGSGSSNF